MRLLTTWTSGGKQHEWPCIPATGESSTDFAARALAEITFQLNAYPPDAGTVAKTEWISSNQKQAVELERGSLEGSPAFIERFMDEFEGGLESYPPDVEE